MANNSQRGHVVDTFMETVKVKRRTPRGYIAIGVPVLARVRLSQSKRGNSHTVIVRFGTDIKVGDHLIFKSQHLEVLRTSDMTGRRVFLLVEADAETAKRSLKKLEPMSRAAAPREK